MTLKFFPENILLFKVDYFEKCFKQNKTDGIVNDPLSSCKL